MDRLSDLVTNSDCGGEDSGLDEPRYECFSQLRIPGRLELADVKKLVTVILGHVSLSSASSRTSPQAFFR
jgi:hypothetical protein